MSGDILTVKTVKRVRSVRGSALVHITNNDNNDNILRIEFHSGCIYWIMNAMIKLANP